MEATFTDLNTPARLLLGPGPSLVPPRVLRAMATPTIGHLDPAYLAVMDETAGAGPLRLPDPEPVHAHPARAPAARAWKLRCTTSSRKATRCWSAWPGYFGERIAEMVTRARGDLRRVDAAWGQVITPGQVEAGAEGAAGQARRDRPRRDFDRRRAAAARDRRDRSPVRRVCCWSTRLRRSAACPCPSTRSASTSATPARRSA